MSVLVATVLAAGLLAQSAAADTLSDLTRLDHLFATAIGRAEKSRPVGSLIARIQRGNLAIVDREMAAPIGGVDGSTWCRLLDEVHVQLALVRVDRLKTAEMAVQTLEHDVRKAGHATGSVLGEFTRLERLLTEAIGRAQKRKSVARLIAQIERGAWTLVARVMVAPVDGLSASTWFALLDRADVQLTLARLRARERRYIVAHLRSAKKLERALAKALRAAAPPPASGAASVQQTDADRAVATYDAMQQYFYAANVYPGDTSSLYVETYPQAGNHYSFLWPFSRALVGTITLSGVPASLLGGASYQSDADDRLTGLSRYWDGTSSGPGYDSYPPAPYGGGGDKYYDDQAWIGLALAQDYQLTGNSGSLAGAQNVFNFVYPGGWAGAASFEPGGIYWVKQGAGVGLTNHDRTMTSTVPNAELALLLESLDPGNAAVYDTGASAMYGWANHYLYNVSANPTDPYGPNPNFTPGRPALAFDKVRGNNTIDPTLWTYNQGVLIAANVRDYRKTGQSAYLADAEAIANTSLNTFTESDYTGSQPPAFNAIFFRGLLVLYSATSDSTLKSRIIQTIQTYADDAWNNYRSPQGLFKFRSSPSSGYRLLDQGAMLQIYAALAWNASDYPKLP